MAMSCNIETKTNRYEETRRRLTRFGNHFTMSDKEIIEYLTEEIEYYRDKIRKLEEHIRKENCNSKEQNAKVIDEDVQEEEITNIYADGKLRQTIINYKYKEK